jgi:hypothetical protein
LTDKVALEKFLKGKSQQIKDYWYGKEARFQAWKAREASKAARQAENHKAWLEREARRKEREEEEQARKAKRDAMETLINSTKSKGGKKNWLRVRLL